MSGVERAEQAVTEARARLVGYLTVAGLSTPRANANLDNLIRAVEARCVAAVHAEPIPDFPPGEDPSVVARTVRSMDLRAIQTGGTSDLLM